jgi:hypothetical protein
MCLIVYQYHEGSIPFIPVMKYRAQDDGVTHINIYSKGCTELGKLLSNFARTPFELPDDGKFFSVEGYWYWRLVPSETEGRDSLRYLSGFFAKKRGRELLARADERGLRIGEGDYKNSGFFRAHIITVFRAKLEANPQIVELLKESTLPFAHYYVFNGVEKAAGYEWQVETWERFRRQLKAGEALTLY